MNRFLPVAVALAALPAAAGVTSRMPDLDREAVAADTVVVVRLLDAEKGDIQVLRTLYGSELKPGTSIKLPAPFQCDFEIRMATRSEHPGLLPYGVQRESNPPTRAILFLQHSGAGLRQAEGEVAELCAYDSTPPAQFEERANAVLASRRTLDAGLAAKDPAQRLALLWPLTEHESAFARSALALLIAKPGPAISRFAQELRSLPPQQRQLWLGGNPILRLLSPQ